MFTMQNRSNINAYMFENAFESDSIEGISLHEEFEKSGEDFEKLKGACIKAKYRTNKENEIRKIKDKVYSLLGKERSLWNLYIENKDRLRMKEFIA